MFPVRYELNSYIIFRRNSVSKGLRKNNEIQSIFYRSDEIFTNQSQLQFSGKQQCH
jgi:hypothetical protein